MELRITVPLRVDGGAKLWKPPMKRLEKRILQDMMFFIKRKDPLVGRIASQCPRDYSLSLILRALPHTMPV